ncbi:MAG TPA: type II toxin-antitoxin system VapC family toxin [Egibacteraceae bacterium]|nr:type II toxin-antitoxin system VapC family toxin [Egibacteraceae bacterium]
MTQRGLVVDASVVVAAFVDSGPHGAWAEQRLSAGPLFGPHLLPVEAANVLRRAELAGDITADTAALAHRDVGRLRVRLLPFAPFAGRVWELRDTLTAYDAWYVAIAETLEAPLATLDARTARAPGPACAFVCP